MCRTYGRVTVFLYIVSGMKWETLICLLECSIFAWLGTVTTSPFSVQEYCIKTNTAAAKETMDDPMDWTIDDDYDGDDFMTDEDEDFSAEESECGTLMWEYLGNLLCSMWNLGVSMFYCSFWMLQSKIRSADSEQLKISLSIHTKT